MSKKSVSIVGVCALALVLAAVAVAAGFKQVANIAFTTQHAGKSTGITADVHSVYDHTQKPKAAKLITITFPSGTKFKVGTVKACPKKLQSSGKCPKSSQIGTGSANAVAYPLPYLVTATVKAYAAGASAMLLVVKGKMTIPGQKPFQQTILIHEKVKGNKLTIPVPSPAVSGFKVVLIGLKLKVPARGSGSKALITAGKCVAKQFVFNARFAYTDGSKADVKSTSPCS